MKQRLMSDVAIPDCQCAIANAIAIATAKGRGVASRAVGHGRRPVSMFPMARCVRGRRGLQRKQEGACAMGSWPRGRLYQGLVTSPNTAVARVHASFLSPPADSGLRERHQKQGPRWAWVLQQRGPRRTLAARRRKTYIAPIGYSLAQVQSRIPKRRRKNIFRTPTLGR